MVNRHKRFISKGIVFALLFAFCMIALRWVFLPKNNWKTTFSLDNFYEMKRGTIDVLFLGSSHTMTSFVPQVLYDDYGIRSYNLGTQEQSLLLSYYWLKEALKYQNPHTVVLDTLMCYKFCNNPLNTGEGHLRLAVDPMRWSALKVDAVSAICEADPNQSISSYYNPLERFHTRWQSLGKDDFNYAASILHGEMKGYVMLAEQNGREENYMIERNAPSELEHMEPMMKEYLDAIAQLCKDNGIRLILVKTPAESANIARYNEMVAYARDNNLPYYDLNEASLFRKIEYNYQNDAADNNGHSNLWGAQKITGWIGQLISSFETDREVVKDTQWEESRYFYDRAAYNAKLCNIVDAVDYFRALNKYDYTVLLAVQDEASSALDESIVEAMHLLGLNEDLRGKFRASYYAIVSCNGTDERTSRTEALSANGTITGGPSYKIMSAGYDAGNACSIVIDNIEYAKKGRGINIVVYDTLYEKVVDSVAFDTFSTQLQAIR